MSKYKVFYNGEEENCYAGAGLQTLEEVAKFIEEISVDFIRFNPESLEIYEKKDYKVEIKRIVQFSLESSSFPQ